MEDQSAISTSIPPVMATHHNSSSSSTTVSSDISSPLSSGKIPPPPVPPAIRKPVTPSVTDLFKGLKLSQKEQEEMFSSLEAIFHRAEEVEGGVGVGELRAVFEHADESSRAGYKDVDALRNVRGILDQMWWSESTFVVSAAEVLANGSRDRMCRNVTPKGRKAKQADSCIAGWRIPFGEAGILDFFLGILAMDGVEHNLKLHTLRLIGNACADTGMLALRMESPIDVANLSDLRQQQTTRCQSRWPSTSCQTTPRHGARRHCNLCAVQRLHGFR